MKSCQSFLASEKLDTIFIHILLFNKILIKENISFIRFSIKTFIFCVLYYTTRVVR